MGPYRGCTLACRFEHDDDASRGFGDKRYVHHCGSPGRPGLWCIRKFGVYPDLPLSPPQAGEGQVQAHTKLVYTPKPRPARATTVVYITPVPQRPIAFCGLFSRTFGELGDRGPFSARPSTIREVAHTADPLSAYPCDEHRCTIDDNRNLGADPGPTPYICCYSCQVCNPRFAKPWRAKRPWAICTSMRGGWEVCGVFHPPYGRCIPPPMRGGWGVEWVSASRFRF